MNKLTKWCHDNGLVINANKTKLMHFRSRHMPTREISILFHGYDCLHTNQQSEEKCTTTIELVDTYKYLGVLLDSNFKWKPHIENVRKKLRKSSYAIYHLSNCAPYHVLRQAYFSLVESYLRHGITAWGNAAGCRTIEAAQNSILKTLMKSLHKSKQNQQQTLDHQRDSTLPSIQSNNTKTLYNNLHILKIKSLYETTIVNEFADDNNLIQHINHSQNTRRRIERRCKVPSYKNDYGKRALAVSLPTTLNRLPLTILNNKNKIKKKIALKSHFINCQ